MENKDIIETMAAELEHLRPMEASLEMAEADVKAYKQRVADLEKEVARLQQYHDTEATKWLAENQKLKENVISMIRIPERCRGLDRKSTLGQIADVMFHHWQDVERIQSNNAQLRKDKANLLRRTEELKDELKSQRLRRLNDKLEHEIKQNYQKYKRCVAIARFCEIAADYANEQRGHCRHDEQDYAEIYYRIFKRKRKWSQIWNSLAERFKEK